MIDPTATTNDIRRIGLNEFEPAKAVLGRAFCDYNLMVYACDNAKRRAPAVTLLYGAMLWDCLVRGEVYVTTDHSGFATWLAPGTALPSFFQQARAGMLWLPWMFGLRGFAQLEAYDKVARRLHHTYAPQPHWYLAVIAVDPEMQGRGIGSRLMAPMLARADNERMACWLDTHQEQNVRLYQRHGFEIAERAEVTGHPIPVYGMLRRPR
jgi:ribosomal protein S18 acetylase RimI-like enzyme